MFFADVVNIAFGAGDSIAKAEHQKVVVVATGNKKGKERRNAK